MGKQGRTISDVVRDIMAGIPETAEFLSHGSPAFRAHGKVFATYTVNHHGDGRVALNLMAPRGAQTAFVRAQPDVYFVPPYVGPNGWLGVQLDKGLSWETVRDHVLDAYEMVAPKRTRDPVKRNCRVKPPTRKFRPEEIDPFQGKAAQSILNTLAAICASLPETAPDTCFGAPVWRVGKKTFVSAHHYTGSLKLSFWVGTERQRTVCKDSHFRVSTYMGHNGWVDLDVVSRQDWDEIKQLALDSYRHFALKRMLKKIDES